MAEEPSGARRLLLNLPAGSTPKDRMSPVNRIILNTFATYGQSVITLILSLFSARWILNALGQTDFGLFGLIGSIILLVGLLNGGLSTGVVRFFSYSIGYGASGGTAKAAEDLNKWFNTAFSIYLVLPLLAVLIGWPIGEHAIRHWLTISEDRVDACIWVFRFSLAAGFISIFAVPFTAMFRAQQRMVELAFVGIVRSFVNFLLAWSLLRVDSDRLIFYAAFMTLITSGAHIFQMVRATYLFPACRPRLCYLFQRDYLRRLLGFAGWKTFGMGCVIMRQQGTPVLANLAFGPVVNAAYSIAQRLSSQADALSSSLMSAFQPALTATEGKGDRNKMLAMAIQICNFGTILVAIFAIPLILKMETLLVLWLVDPPPYAASICRWLLAMIIIDKMTSGAMLGVNAYGRIALYEVVQGSLFLLALPLMWVFFRSGYSPEAIGFALFCSHLMYCAGRIIFAKRLIDFPVLAWVRKSALPLAVTITMAAAAGFVVPIAINDHVFGLLVTAGASATAIGTMSWLLLFTDAEKLHAVNLMKLFIRRLRAIGATS